MSKKLYGNSRLAAGMPRTGMAFLFAVVAGCGTSPSPQTAMDQRDRLVAKLAGNWNNAVQFATAPAALEVPPSVTGDWLNRKHAAFTRVEATAIGERVLYLEWRNGGRDEAISRQRIWSFRTDAAGAIRMDFYAFVDGKPWADRAAEAGAFRGLTLDALRSYGPACGLTFTATNQTFAGAISAKDCTLTAASGRKMGIDASVQLTSDGALEYLESGQLEDGRYAFRVPPSQPYRFVRLR